MGWCPFLCDKEIRDRLRSIHGENQLWAEALPQEHNADFRRGDNSFSVHVHKSRKGYYNGKSGRQRFSGLRYLRSYRTGRDYSGLPIHPGVRAEPRLPASDRNRSGGWETDGTGRGVPRHSGCLLWRRFQLLRHRFSIHEAQYPWRQEDPFHCCRALLLPETYTRQVRIWLRWRGRNDPSSSHVHPGPQLQTGIHTRRRPALSRRRSHSQPAYEGWIHGGGRYRADGFLQGRSAIRPDWRHNSSSWILSCHCSNHHRGS